MLYNKNYALPLTSDEIKLVNHVRKSYERAMKLESKLNESGFIHDEEVKIWKVQTPSDHLLNNLCNLEGASHLHVGLLKGGSFIAALWGNQDLLKDQIGIDWFQEFSEDLFHLNCRKYLELDKCLLINCDCFNVEKSIFTQPIDIYFYDADHSLKGHEKAFTYYDDLFQDVFVAMVDDWKCPWIRKPTFKAFDKLGYQILYETTIPASEANGHGQYIAVIKKSLLSK